MFSWFDELKLTPIILKIRQITIPFKINLPDWILYSLPDGLWIFSYTSLVLLLFNNLFNWKSAFWILLIFFFSITIELLQLFDKYPGTFDLYDIFFYILGLVLPIIIFLNKSR